MVLAARCRSGDALVSEAVLRVMAVPLERSSQGLLVRGRPGPEGVLDGPLGTVIGWLAARQAQQTGNQALAELKRLAEAPD